MEAGKDQEKIERAARPPLSFRLPDDLEADLDSAVKRTGLKKSDVARQAIRRGLPIFLAQLDSVTA